MLVNVKKKLYLIALKQNAEDSGIYMKKHGASIELVRNSDNMKVVLFRNGNESRQQVRSSSPNWHSYNIVYYNMKDVN